MLLQLESDFSSRLHGQNMVDVVCLRFPTALVRLLLIAIYSISILADGLMHFKQSGYIPMMCIDVPMLALELTKGPTKSEKITRICKIPPRPSRNSYLNHWGCISLCHLIDLMKILFLDLYRPCKNLLSVTFKFALFFVMLLFRILPETTRVGESRKPKIDSFSIHAWTSETSSMPSWSHGAKCGSRISASSNTIVRWGRMKSLCLENLEKWWEM